MTNKLVTADAAKLLADGGVRRIYRVDSHIGERESVVRRGSRRVARWGGDRGKSTRGCCLTCVLDRLTAADAPHSFSRDRES